MQNNEDQDWTPPPPPDDSSIFSSSTRNFYEKEIGIKARNSVIFGILSLFCCGIIFGFLGYISGNDAINNIETYGLATEKRTMAQVGKTLSIIGFIVWLGTLILAIAERPWQFGR